MQTVWSRVAQVRSTCRCASCTVKTSVTRHSATATGKRPTKYLTTSTLLYSGIFAVAATTDALVKEKRRQQWDHAIEGAKAGVEQARVRIEALEETKHIGELDLRDHDSAVSLLDDADAAYRYPSRLPQGHLWPENSGHPFDQGNFGPASIWASDRYRSLGKEQPWTTKKLRLNELAMDQLTVNILLLLRQRNLLTKDSIEDAFTDDFKRLMKSSQPHLKNLLRVLDKSIRETRRRDVEAPEADFARPPGVMARYSQDSSFYFVETSAAVEQSIRHTFEQHCRGELTKTQMLLRTLHKMATSTAPPNLSTFNYLLQGFNKRDMEPRISLEIIRSMRQANMRMNEESFVAILQHYIRTNDNHRFRRWLSYMQGLRGGLNLARPDVWVTERSQGRLVPVEQGNGQRKLVQKPVANPIVLSAIIQGVLHFDGFEAALDMCQSMGSEGWGLSMKGLTPLLRDCAKRRDWTSGMAVWDQIKRVQKLSERRGSAELVQSWTYATMLQLCVACGKKSDFSSIMAEATKKSNLTQDTLAAKLRHLSLEMQEKQSPSYLHRSQTKLQRRKAEDLAPAVFATEVVARQDDAVAGKHGVIDALSDEGKSPIALTIQEELSDDREMSVEKETFNTIEQVVLAEGGFEDVLSDIVDRPRGPWEFQHHHDHVPQTAIGVAFQQHKHDPDKAGRGPFRFFRPLETAAYV